MQTNPFDSYSHLIFTVLRSPAREVAAMVCESWNEDEDVEPDRQRYHLLEVPFDLRYAYINKPPPPKRSGWDPTQLLFWEPTTLPDHCVMMTNAVCGNQHGVFRMSEEVSWEWVYVAMRDRDNQAPSFMFDYYRDFRKVSRRIGVGQEENGRWLFCEEGPVQPFEDPSFYKKRRILDRFNREVITTYMQRLGYEIADPDFWTSRAGAWLLWDDWNGARTRPGRDGVDEEGTRFGWSPT